MEEMFQGGLLPGVLLMSLIGAWGVIKAPALRARRRFDSRAAWSSLWIAKWELLVPVVAIGTLFSGLATPVEAAAATALLAFVVETFVYRDLRLVRDVPRVVGECGLLVGGVMLILGVAMGFTQFLIDAQIPDQGVAWVQSNIQSPLVFLLILNVFLLIVGCLMDIYSAIVVVVPLLVPIGQAFGIVFLANLELGFLTPPVGMNLFLSSYRFNKPVVEVARSVLPFLLLMLGGVLLITYVPWMTTWVPSLFK
jgi:tripartite ATP-independent transporter DctM subunit